MSSSGSFFGSHLDPSTNRTRPSISIGFLSGYVLSVILGFLEVIGRSGTARFKLQLGLNLATS